MLQQIDRIPRWDRLQEPMCRSNLSAGYLRLLGALDSGWSIYWIGLRPAQERNEPGELCFTLVRSEDGEMRTLLLPQCCELAPLLSAEQRLAWGVSQAGLL